MTYSTMEDEFCRSCGVTVTWTGEQWIHDYESDDCSEPSVPYDPYDD